MHKILEISSIDSSYVVSTSSYDTTKYFYVGMNSWYTSSSYDLVDDESPKGPSNKLTDLSYDTSDDDFSKASSSDDGDSFELFEFFLSSLSN